MKPNERINGFDALRSIAMWLGVVLHSLIVYKATPAPNWPHDESAGYVFFDWLYEYIHIFRMPLFYFVAGFFSRLVIVQKGMQYFIDQRFRRIFIPFVLSSILLLPVSLLPFHFYKFFYGERLTLTEAISGSCKQMLHWNGFAHLWFLYYLLIFYIIGATVFSLLKKLNIQLEIKLRIFFETFGFLKIIIFILALWLLLHFFKAYTPPVYTGIKPNLEYLLYYGFFFFWGWVMQVNIKSIFSLTRFSWLFFISGLLLSVLRFIFKDKLSGPISYLTASVETVFLVTGFIGIFLKYFSSNSKRWRYFSDSSYWVYLVHLVIVSSTQILLLNTFIPPFLRMPIVFIITLILSLVSYHLFVRFTIIGTYLHGKRERK